MIEPQEEFCGCRRCRRKSCLEIILGILFTAFAVVLGLIIGASVATAILAALPALIVLISILALLIIISLVWLACDRRNC